MREHMPPVVVVGAGAAGMMAAISAARRGAQVVLVEPNEKVGRKLYITGKGRCNVTNHCGLEALMAAIPRNGKFLYSALSRFGSQEAMAFFEDLGVKLKVERGNRVFPVSDKAADIIDALFFELRRLGVELRRDRVTGLQVEDHRVVGVTTRQQPQGIPASWVIVATGGASYPRTGSTGDGYQLAQQVGHQVVMPRGSLVPLESPDPCCGQMQGLALRNVVMRVKNKKGKVVYQEMGELLFTHFGLSGPLVLSASAHMNFERDHYTVHIDLKPALDEGKLDTRLVRDLTERANQNMGNALGGLLPQSMIPVVVRRAGISLDTKAHDLRKEQRRSLLETMKNFTVDISGPRPVEEAIVTAGGVKVGEVDPKTMASKKVEGLSFAGEVLNVDAYTGGFNLQIAWATGWVAGEAAAEQQEKKDGAAV
ncbi:NAD(P)/FAD-dependent oxidoreductase [Pseudoflavonifractor sp. An85]|uniref:NAD(P)/FAD-dependent oxidoreductase n=1 Tax=Pseudoflavonifractor sp. An85 TaxID=1965661 RepID=UPI001FA8EA7C|nr:NAD(P)/FAD-dependent oxidoreductase [Pseudoflavonifractor sp. An85]